MGQITVRLSDELSSRLQTESAKRGFGTPSAFVRHAIDTELRQGESALSQVEERIAATVNRLAKEVRSVRTAQLATFALVEAFAKAFLTCVPEPPGELVDQARARAKRRHEKLLIAVAQGMAGESRGALKELSRVEE